MLRIAGIVSSLRLVHFPEATAGTLQRPHADGEAVDKRRHGGFRQTRAGDVALRTQPAGAGRSTAGRSFATEVRNAPSGKCMLFIASRCCCVCCACVRPRMAASCAPSNAQRTTAAGDRGVRFIERAQSPGHITNVAI